MLCKLLCSAFHGFGLSRALVVMSLILQKEKEAASKQQDPKTSSRESSVAEVSGQEAEPKQNERQQQVARSGNAEQKHGSTPQFVADWHMENGMSSAAGYSGYQQQQQYQQPQFQQQQQQFQQQPFQQPQYNSQYQPPSYSQQSFGSSLFGPPNYAQQNGFNFVEVKVSSGGI